MCEDLCMLYTFLLLFLTNYLFSHIQLKSKNMIIFVEGKMTFLETKN